MEVKQHGHTRSAKLLHHMENTQIILWNLALTIVTDAFLINKSNFCVRVCDFTTEHTKIIQTMRVKVTLRNKVMVVMVMSRTTHWLWLLVHFTHYHTRITTSLPEKAKDKVRVLVLLGVCSSCNNLEVKR